MRDDQPESGMKPVVQLHGWAILRCKDIGMILAGAQDAELPRTSMPLVALDPIAMTADTESGQRYQLRGDPEPSYALGALEELWDTSGVEVTVVDLHDAAEEVARQRLEERDAETGTRP